MTSRPQMAASLCAFLLAALALNVDLRAQTSTTEGRDVVERWNTNLREVADLKADEAARAMDLASGLRRGGVASGRSAGVPVAHWPTAYVDDLYEAARAAGLVDRLVPGLPGTTSLDARSFSKRRLDAGLKKYAPVILPILREHELPDELIAVALVESGFRPDALSPRGALGLWQLMPATARRFGLNPEATFDERLDPIRSTHAAARYLKELYALWNDWELALAAYNAGENRIQRATVRAQTTRFSELAARRLLPQETRRYVPAVLSAARLFSRSGLATSTGGEPQKPPATTATTGGGR